jgi:hypothetical protein
MAVIKITKNPMSLPQNSEKKTWRCLGLRNITKDSAFIKKNEVTLVLDQRTERHRGKTRNTSQCRDIYLKKSMKMP